MLYYFTYSRQVSGFVTCYTHVYIYSMSLLSMIKMSPWSKNLCIQTGKCLRCYNTVIYWIIWKIYIKESKFLHVDIIYRYVYIDMYCIIHTHDYMMNRFTDLQVKLEPWPSRQVPPFKHRVTLVGVSRQTSMSMSQFFPVYPSRQKHAYLSIKSTQEPPFRHGLEEHSYRWENSIM